MKGFGKAGIAVMMVVLSMILPMERASAKDADSITIVTRLTALPGQTDAARRVLWEIVPAARGIQGCLSFNTAQNANAASVFLVRETWKDEKARKAYMETKAYKIFSEKKPYLFESQYEQTLTCHPYKGPESMSKSPSTVVTLCTAREGMLETAKNDFLFLTAQSHTEEGNYQYNFFQGIYDPAVFIEDEIWRDHDAVDVHMASSYFKYLWNKAPSLFLPIEGIDIPFNVMICDPQK